MTVRDFACDMHENYLTEELLAEHAALFPHAFYRAPEMAALAGILAEKLASPIAFLPFDYMAEAEALGARVKGGADIAGLRGDGHILQELRQLAALPAMDFSTGRIAQILAAINLVKQAGYTPCLNLTGFLTVTDCLLPITQVFMGWQKEQAVLKQFFNRFAQHLLAYVTLARQNGAAIFSYADPMAAISLVGPKLSKEICENYTAPFLKALQKHEKGVVLHLCGKTSYALEQAGLAKTEVLPLAEPMLYTQALAKLAETGETVMIGHGCINKKRTTTKLIKIQLL